MSLGQGFVAVTPSDTVDIQRNEANNFPAALYVGTTGNISIVGADGDAVTFTNVPVGILPVRARRVNATGTTASGIVGIYV